MEQQQTQDIPQSVINHIGRMECDKIKFLELYFNIHLKWYQKMYLKFFLNKDVEEIYDKFLKIKEGFDANYHQR